MGSITVGPMSREAWNWSQKYAFSTDAKEAKRILQEVLAQLTLQNWEDKDVFGVHLAVEEALMNAIKHGNQLDKTKEVQFSVKTSPDRIFVEITDQGAGFDPDDVPDPTEDDNLELPSGRGLMLMRCYMNTVEFNAVGNQVRMEKLRSGGS